MKSILKLIWENTPKWIRTVLFTCLLLSAAGFIIGDYLDDSKLDFSQSALQNILIAFVIIFVFGYIIGCYKVIKNQREVIKKLNSNRTLKKENYKNLKSLPTHLDILVFEKDMIEWTLRTKRCWLPTDNPHENVFSENITITEGRCKTCKSNLDSRSQHGKSYIFCPNSTCVNFRKFLLEESYKYMTKQALVQVTSEVRQDFNKYWDNYCKEYDKLTNRKYDEFSTPYTYD